MVAGVLLSLKVPALDFIEFKDAYVTFDFGPGRLPMSSNQDCILLHYVRATTILEMPMKPYCLCMRAELGTRQVLQAKPLEHGLGPLEPRVLLLILHLR